MQYRIGVLILIPVIINAGVLNDSLTIKTTDGELMGLGKGVNYIAQPDPLALKDSLMILPEVICGYGTALTIIVQADSGANLSMRFDLPTILFGYPGPSLSCSFHSYSLVSGVTNNVMDPNDTIVFQMNPNGIDTFYLGIQVNVPSDASMGILYEAPVTCYIRDTGTGDSSETTALYQASVYTPITIDATDANLNNLSTNISYDLDPEYQTITPIINGSENGSSMTFSISGEPDANIEIYLSLPESLSGLVPIPCLFSQTSGFNTESGYRFNPNQSFLAFALHPTSGVLNLRLGISVWIPPGTPDGSYVDTVHIVAYYTGLSLAAQSLTPTFSCHYGDAHAIYTVNFKDEMAVGRDGSIPERYLLHQNYPNPFNPGTTISYEIPQESYVTLIVTDVLGQKITTLVNGRQRAGVHSVAFDGTQLTSGTYFYRIIAGTFSQTKRFVVIR